MLGTSQLRRSCDHSVHSYSHPCSSLLRRRPFQPVRAWHTTHKPHPGPPSRCGVQHRQHRWLAGTPLDQHRRGTALQAAAELRGLIPLSQDVMTFLASTVFVIPVFRRLKVSPILGYLLSGLILQRFGMIKDLKDVDELAELGVLFLLFEMGLELSVDRLKALAKYAFGMGSLQVFISTVAFTAFALPLGAGVGTLFLERISDAPDALVSIRSIDEAVVIGASLSLSSSAFVLQLMAERGEMQTRFGAATLGILLMQDIAVVPFLVLLPLIEGGQGVAMGGASPVSLLTVLGPTVLKTLLGLGLLLLGGRFVLRRIFELVAESRSSESFISLCLLTVTGAAQLTEKLGLSDTMGAFIAGVLLSETSYRTQVEADIKPFRTLLLGLFFVTTGCSINTAVLVKDWEVIAWLTVGLIAVKSTIIAALGPTFGLNRAESIRTAFMLSQGGEFAFVLLSLANQLKLLPEELNQVLIIVVVLSMALTPALAELGKVTADWADAQLGGVPQESPSASLDDPTISAEQMEESVVICGFGAPGQVLANMLESPVASGSSPVPYVAFDTDVARVRASRQAGFNVVYGDAARAALVTAAGVKRPKAIVVCYSSQQQVLHAVEALRQYFGDKVPIYACAADMAQAAGLREAGATSVVISPAEQGLAMGGLLLDQLGASPSQVGQLKDGIGAALGRRTEALVVASAAHKGKASEGHQEQQSLQQQLRSRLKASGSSNGTGTARDGGSSTVPAASSSSSAYDVFVYDTGRRAKSEASLQGDDAAEQLPEELQGGLLLATYDEDSSGMVIRRNGSSTPVCNGGSAPQGSSTSSSGSPEWVDAKSGSAYRAPLGSSVESSAGSRGSSSSGMQEELQEVGTRKGD